MRNLYSSLSGAGDNTVELLNGVIEMLNVINDEWSGCI